MVSTAWNDLEIAQQPTVLRAARQFAEALENTAQFIEFEKSYSDFRSDNESQVAYREFQQKQSSLKALLMLDAVSESDRKELQRMQEKFSSLPSVIRYLKAQGELMEMCQCIGDLLSQELGLDYGNSCKSGGCCG